MNRRVVSPDWRILIALPLLSTGCGVGLDTELSNDTTVKLSLEEATLESSATAGTSIPGKLVVRALNSGDQGVAFEDLSFAFFEDSNCLNIGSGTLSTDQVTADESGYATLSDISYTKAGTFYVGVQSSNHVQKCLDSFTITITPATLSVVAFTSEASGTYKVNETITPAPVVKASDEYGNGIEGTSILLYGYIDPSCTTSMTGSLSSSSAVTDSNGEATLNGLASSVAQSLYFKAQSGSISSPCTEAVLSIENTLILAKGGSGANHTCVVFNGVAKCWGQNTNGQLGNGTNTSQTVPVNVTGLTSDMTMISAGLDHSCASNGSTIQCWGMGTSGQLGNNAIASVNAPVSVANVTGAVSSLSAGHSFTCAVMGGEIKCWGFNAQGQVGNSVTATYPSSPTSLTTAITQSSTVSAGGNFACGLLADGARCWGDGAGYKLGNNNTSAPQLHIEPTGLGSGVTAISTGSSHTCAIKQESAYCWGANLLGQLGINTNSTAEANPTQINTLGSSITNISAGGSHTCAIASGAAYCWGNNSDGQLGIGNNTSQNTPTLISDLSSGVTDIVAFAYHTCAIHNNTLKCWGNNASGQLGVGDSSDRLTPALVTGL